ncbi:hypothetical protein HWB99_gp071 [Mycobacterium phage DrLupo]|uniref:Uncharacterized protein n=1 Tax=Mycobacterium phage DrLupo TaxID=2499037 RepID=A0A3S9UQN1_9CAUD|nr:hypothetical protein HWB99_gp071 [Mycobacterium phage DrLupo]AZS12607.1 hypothetical protein SEA_DRLUPO_71 [Mycobacterium phage DrLupo]
MLERAEITDITVRPVAPKPDKGVEKADETFCDFVRDGRAENSCILVHRRRMAQWCDGCINFAKEKVIQKYQRKQ